MPIRMCAVCRERFNKPELSRIVRSENGEIVIDKLQKAQSRGIYVCKNCVKDAQKKRILEREYKCKIESYVYERLVLEAENND